MKKNNPSKIWPFHGGKDRLTALWGVWWGRSLGFWRTAVRNDLPSLTSGSIAEEGTRVLIAAWTTGNCEADCSLPALRGRAELQSAAWAGLYHLSLPSQGCLIAQ